MNTDEGPNIHRRHQTLKLAGWLGKHVLGHYLRREEEEEEEEAEHADMSCSHSSSGS